MYKRLHAAAAAAQPGLIYALTFLSASPPKSHQKQSERLKTCNNGSLFLHPDGVATKHLQLHTYVVTPFFRLMNGFSTIRAEFF